MGLMPGIFPGKTIKLDDETDIPDGQRVMLIVQFPDAASSAEGKSATGESIRCDFGYSVEDSAELNAYLARFAEIEPILVWNCV
jgi:hypothetical protein